MTFQIKNTILGLVFVAIFTVAALTFSGVITIPLEMIGGWPAPVLWSVGLCAAFFVLACVGYFFLFKEWAERIDGEDSSL